MSSIGVNGFSGILVSFGWNGLNLDSSRDSPNIDMIEFNVMILDGYGIELSRPVSARSCGCADIPVRRLAGGDAATELSVDGALTAVRQVG